MAHIFRKSMSLLDFTYKKMWTQSKLYKNVQQVQNNQLFEILAKSDSNHSFNTSTNPLTVKYN